MCENDQIVSQRHKVNNTFWKMSCDSLAWCGICGVIADLQVVKKKKKSSMYETQ